MGNTALVYDRIYRCEETVAQANFSPNIGWTSKAYVRNAKNPTHHLGILIYCVYINFYRPDKTVDAD